MLSECATYILLLLVDMANLEPDIFFRQRPRRISDNVFEALNVSKLATSLVAGKYLQRLVELVLLLVDNAQSEVDLIGFLKVGCHAHDLGKGLFRVVQGTISVIQDADSVPEFGFLLY